jgi:formylglycine-generating enzyme required for sulfatase activity
MKKILIGISILLLTPLALAADKKPIKRAENIVAVIDIESTGKVDKDLVRPLTDSVRKEIVKSGKYEVMDRGNMDKILKEQAFQMTGCTSKECAVEAGQLLGVGKIVVGSVSIIGKTYLLSLSLVNVETGKVEWIEDQECKCEIDDLISLSKQVSAKLIGSSSSVLPAEKASAPARNDKIFRDAATGMEFVLVRGVCFDKGDTFGDGDYDEKPVENTCLNDFYLGRFEVTQKEWIKIMGDNPSKFKKCGDTCPVESVSYGTVNEFIYRLSRTSGQKYRLPNRAEWEYAARSGGKKEKYSGVNNEDEVADHAWYNANADGVTHVVGQKKPNGLGLYDMSGNVWEWTSDIAVPMNAYGPKNTIERVVQGGCWNSKLRDIRAANGDNVGEAYRDQTIGFRLVLEP